MKNTTNTTRKATTINALAIVDGVNAPFVAKCVEYATISQSRDQLGATLKADFAAILASTGTKEAVAAKQLAASLATALEGVVSHPAKRASEILVALGIRQRAGKDKDKDDKDTSLDGIIAALKDLAKEQAGEKAISALRRAYLSLQAENNAE
jgi:hypothetical protein